jgi:Domain of unknown function (DUF1707)
VTTGPADEKTAAVARGRLRAAHADREHVIGTLKAAFVQGRLTKDELDLRIGQTLAARTYAELARLTADVPAGLVAAAPLHNTAPPRNTAPARARPPMHNAAKGGICVAVALAALVLTAYVTGGQALFAFVPLYSVALLVATAQVLDSRHQKRSRRQLPPPAAQ